jgi:hypothetical protein
MVQFDPKLVESFMRAAVRDPALLSNVELAGAMRVVLLRLSGVIAEVGRVGTTLATGNPAPLALSKCLDKTNVRS